MVVDFPDFTNGIQIVGSSINVPITIAASTATINVSLTASSVTVNISVVGQTVAVYDGPQFQATLANEKAISGSASCNSASTVDVVTHTVPAGKSFYCIAMSYSINTDTTQTFGFAELVINGVVVGPLGSAYGAGVTFSQPLVATAGQIIKVTAGQRNSGGLVETIAAGFWGWEA